MKEKIEIRCPEHKFRLFAKVVKVDKETNCFEIRCRECSKAYTKKMIEKKLIKKHQKVDVFHYFNLLGFIETKIKPVEKEVVNNGS